MRRRALWVTVDPGDAPLLPGWDVVTVTPETAIAQEPAEATEDPVIVAPFTLRARGDGLELLRRASREVPASARVLRCDFADLQEILRQNGREFLDRALPRDASPRQVARVLENATSGPMSLPLERDLGSPLPHAAATALLRATCENLAGVRGMVLRDLPSHEKELHIEFVLPLGVDFDRLHCRLPMEWGWPQKERHQRIEGNDAAHPVVRVLGGLARDQEVYCRLIEGTVEEYVFIAVLPWSGRPRVTVMVGMCAPEFRDELRVQVAGLHQEARGFVGEFYLPLVPDLGERALTAHYVPEYNWFATKSYVGPDRRTEATSFANRHVFVGKRTHVPALLVRALGSYVDRVSSYAFACIALYAALSLVDTYCTWRYISHGPLREMNPLMRALLAHHPALFVVGKNALSIALILAVSRFQVSRAGKAILTLNTAIYAGLVVYWAWLIAR